MHTTIYGVSRYKGDHLATNLSPNLFVILWPQVHYNTLVLHFYYSNLGRLVPTHRYKYKVHTPYSAGPLKRPCAVITKESTMRGLRNRATCVKMLRQPCDARHGNANIEMTSSYRPIALSSCTRQPFDVLIGLPKFGFTMCLPRLYVQTLPKLTAS